MPYSDRKHFIQGWVASLTFLAGAINVTAMYLLNKTISHQTGSISNAAIALGEGKLTIFFDMSSYIALFFLGAFISGFTIYQRNRGVRILHSLYPILFGVLLIIAYFIPHQVANILRFMALGMGLQNGTHIRYHHIQIRTTHMTGYLTDAAVNLGKLVRGHKEALFSVKVFLASITVFFCGGLFSIIMILNTGFTVFLVLGCMYILVGLFVYSFHPKTM